MGVLGALETILGLDDNQMKSAAVDIFSYIVEFSPSMVREFIVQEGQKQDDVSMNLPNFIKYVWLINSAATI